MRFPDVVIDASITIAGLCPDEVQPRAVHLMEEAIGSGARVPAIWIFEIVNIISQKRRRNLLSAGTASQILKQLSECPIIIEPVDLSDLRRLGSGAILRHALSSYDAAHLDLAIRRGAPLATLDRALAAAARSEGIEVI